MKYSELQSQLKVERRTYNHASMCTHVEIILPGIADSLVNNSTYTRSQKDMIGIYVQSIRIELILAKEFSGARVDSYETIFSSYGCHSIQ